MAKWRERARKAWAWWEHFDAVQGLVGFAQQWGRLSLFIATWGVATGSVVVALVFYVLDALSALWVVAVALAAIVFATVPNVILFRLGLRPARPERQAPEPRAEERGTITIVEPLLPMDEKGRDEKAAENVPKGALPGDRTYLGTGIYDGVKWTGWRLANGYVEADGPFCPRDDAELGFKGSWPDPVPVKDYQVVHPPDTRLCCSKCGHEFYLSATPKEGKRVGDTREHAAWRLGGGETRYESLLRQMGLR